jgi:gamma-polyglutamate synthase
MIGAVVLLALLLLLGTWERFERDRAVAAVPIRIHVNGTRGKSTTTRLIAGALREAGIVTLAKTTGTAPRLILPDGREQPIVRRGPASIREQLWFMREARRQRVSAVVVECMAIAPELQRVCERDILRATIGVFTNVRPDHGDVMGPSPDEVARALAETVPARGVVVLGSADHAGPILDAAVARESRIVQPAAPAPPDGPPDWMAENVAVACAVARELGIDADAARRGSAAAAPDPGAVRRERRTIGSADVRLVDALAANDPESLVRLLGPRTAPAIFVFHHRADRPYRLRQFADAPPWTAASDALIVTGDRPDLATWRRLRRTSPGLPAAFVPRRRLGRTLATQLGHAAGSGAVVLCGNTKGFSPRILDALPEDASRG